MPRRTITIFGGGQPLPLAPVVTPAPTPSPTPSPPALVGFALNGSANPALKAMMARVKAGTGRGRIVFKGDSTTAGSSELTANQRIGRVSKYVADKMTTAGYPTFDNAFVGNNGALVQLPGYDSRVVFDGAFWAYGGGQNFSGGNFLDPGSTTPGGFLRYTLPNVTHFIADFYNVGGNAAFAVDNVAASGITAPGATVTGNSIVMPNGNGFTRVTIPAGSLGTHELAFINTAGNSLCRMAMGWNANASGIDILNHASGGATSRDQAASGSGWSNNDALGFDAPDLTIINCTLNTGNNYSDALHRSYLQAMVDKAKLSGDALMVAPHEATPGFLDLALQAQNRLAAQAVAQSSGVAFLDLNAYLSDRLGAPGGYQAILNAGLFVDTEAKIVHLKTGGYSIVGDGETSAIQAMAA